jgi:hypothetical protein
MAVAANPAAGSISLAGSAAQIVSASNLRPGTAALLFTGTAPTSGAFTLAPSTGTVQLTGAAAAQDVSIAPPAGHLVLASEPARVALLYSGFSAYLQALQGSLAQPIAGAYLRPDEGASLPQAVRIAGYLQPEDA